VSAPAERDITIVAGDDYTHTVTFTVGGVTADVSADTYSASIRKSGSVTEAELAAFAVDQSNASHGVVVFSLTSTQTRAVAAAIAEGGWDVQRVRAGKRRTVLAGTVTMEGDGKFL
jgi:hypothetical protein